MRVFHGNAKNPTEREHLANNVTGRQPQGARDERMDGALATQAASYLDTLNEGQRAAVTHGIDAHTAMSGTPPLLIIAGAGSGKTMALAHRVAHLIVNGADPAAILLLTFTRRAALEMTRRVERICARALGAAAPARIPWAGTFHGIANRLLRSHAEAIGLDPAFTVLDRADAADLMNLVRSDLGFATKASRFPRKDTCLAIYSHVVNARRPLFDILEEVFPWCADWAHDLQSLFAGYVDAKQNRNVADFDDLLLYWHHMMSDPAVAAAVGADFDHILVDEYQDTNALQANILRALKPTGVGVNVVGDDAQAIYGFRAATVRNILDFPDQFAPKVEVCKLEQNYRSSRPILDVCNAVIGLSSMGFDKSLFSTRTSSEKPYLITAADETAQVDYVVSEILAAREAGTLLKDQAVLFRTSHHSDRLEVELGRRNIPYVKFGGLKFLETGHIKDVICVLRWAENPRDEIAAFRVLQLLPGIGPVHARRIFDAVTATGSDIRQLAGLSVPIAARNDWPALCTLMAGLIGKALSLGDQVSRARDWYKPHLERVYQATIARDGDLDQLEHIASGYQTREQFLSELALDPPAASGDHAGAPLLDEDYLILSTIHSAKGQEWDSVYLLNAADGCIPSDMATGSADQIEEERRLLYVAMTRARQSLHLVHPLRFFKHNQPRHGDSHMFAPRTRFIPDALLPLFTRKRQSHRLDTGGRAEKLTARVDVKAKMRAMWQD